MAICCVILVLVLCILLLGLAAMTNVTWIVICALVIFLGGTFMVAVNVLITI